MSYSFKVIFLSALAITGSQLVYAQTTLPRTVSDSLEANAPISKMVYQSAFIDYRKWADGPIKVWREANDEVGKSGGHAGHNMSQNEEAPESMDHMNHPMK